MMWSKAGARRAEAQAPGATGEGSLRGDGETREGPEAASKKACKGKLRLYGREAKVKASAREGRVGRGP